MNMLHVGGVVLRNFYLIKKSWHRMFNLFYWSFVQLFLWGFITLYFKEEILGANTAVNLVVLLLGALIFWELFWRAQLGVTMAFLEDMWARNLVNIFIAPLRTSELVLGFVVLSLLQSVISFVIVSAIAWVLYALNIWSFGFYMVPLVFNIFLFGWALGFVMVGMVIRFGPSFEMLAWSIPVLMQPLSAVFYPVTVLPLFLQKIAFFLPTMHLFEGMRIVLLQEVFPGKEILLATVLSAVYFVLALVFLYWMLRVAKRKGLIGRFVSD
jgi:ABC-2 type transport system permease protein